MARRIDSHQHFWKYDPVRDAWITPDMEVIRRDFLPGQLKTVLDEHQIDGSIAVQVDQTAKETLRLIRHAEENPFIKGVVGWIDFRGPQVGEQLEYLSQNQNVKGFRHIVQAEPDGFLLTSDFLKGIEQLSRLRFTYDILVYHSQLPDAIAFARKFPNLRLVVDHLAKPAIRTHETEPWKNHIRELASMENVYCKISGMVTEADWREWTPDDLKPYLDTVFECFGPRRVMYGSDWPVCLLAASYGEQLAIVEDYILDFTLAEKELIMGENAAHFYNL